MPSFLGFCTAPEQVCQTVSPMKSSLLYRKIYQKAKMLPGSKTYWITSASENLWRSKAD
jgi:hypothetical protein